MKLTIEIRAKPEKFQELYQTLQALLPRIRKEKGTQDCHIYRDVEDGDVFYFSIHWEDAANRESFLRSTSGSTLLGAVDMLSETASVRVGNDAPTTIEVLKKMRK